MTEVERNLLQAIIVNPDSDEPRFGYADWLEQYGDRDETGKNPRARFIRLQCEIAGLQGQADTLLEKHRAEWDRPFQCLGATECEYHRGFPENLTIPAEELLANQDRLLRLTPVRSLKLGLAMDEHLEKLATVSMPDGIRSLTIGAPGFTRRHGYGPGKQFGADGVAELVKAPWFSNVTSLTLHSPRLRQATAEHIAASPNARALTHLFLDDPAYVKRGDRSLEIIACSPNLRNLKLLRMPYNYHPGEDLAAVRTRVEKHGHDEVAGHLR